MKRTEAYLRLADACEREASTAKDAGERRQFGVLSRALRNWAADPPADDLEDPAGNDRPQKTSRP